MCPIPCLGAHEASNQECSTGKRRNELQPWLAGDRYQATGKRRIKSVALDDQFHETEILDAYVGIQSEADPNRGPQYG